MHLEKTKVELFFYFYCAPFKWTMLGISFDKNCPWTLIMIEREYFVGDCAAKASSWESGKRCKMIQAKNLCQPCNSRHVIKLHSVVGVFFFRNFSPGGCQLFGSAARLAWIQSLTTLLSKTLYPKQDENNLFGASSRA